MGCGESKHAVATANTITQTKRSNSRKEKTIETSVDNAVNPSVEEQSRENGNSSGETKESNVVKEIENVSNGPEDNDNVKETIKAEEKESDDHVVNRSSSAEVENVKEIEEHVVDNKELKEENFQVKENVVHVQDEESHHFFSPRKDGETIESIISDGLSGKSEYHSPRARKIEPEELTKESDVVNKKGSPEKTKNEEAVNVNEGKDSAITKEEKASIAKEEIVTEASTKDSKTN